MFKPMTSVEDTRRPKDEHMFKHLTSVNHKLLSKFSMSEGWVPLLITDLIGKNGAIDPNGHFNP